MNINELIETHYRSIQSYLGSSATLAQIEARIRELVDNNVLTADAAEPLLGRFQAELSAHSPPQMVWPRLLVDWGDTPRVGRQVRPEFCLFCLGFPGRPEVRVEIDRDLDHDDDPGIRLYEQEQGVWIFHQAFRLTSDGQDCRPGQYLIDLQISFHQGPSDLPRKGRNYPNKF